MEQAGTDRPEISSLHDGPGLSPAAYDEAIERRRALRLPGYATLADVGFDGPWVTPLQITAGSLSGPVLIALHWLDEASIHTHHEVLLKVGHLPRITFNRVLDRALALVGRSRADVYLTQCFHLIPQARSEAIPAAAIDLSFREVTRHEIAGRPVLALGSASAGACRRADVEHRATLHPSARGLSFEARAQAIAVALRELLG